MTLYAYKIAVTEYERGWGSRADGHVFVKDEDTADIFIKDKYKDRTDQVPSYYVSYDKVGIDKVSEIEFKLIHSRGFVYR